MKRALETKTAHPCLELAANHGPLGEAGQTYSSVLNATRVDLAEHLVAGRRYSLTEVADLVGFSSASNFSRWFRNEFGCSPTQWRAKHRTAA